jgi:hypothetical protein
MKNNSLRIGAFLALPMLTFAQSNDQVVADVLGTSSR